MSPPPPRSRPRALRREVAPTPDTRRDSESKPHRPANLSRDQSRVSEDDDDIHVIKRNGKKEVVRYDKITSRIKEKQVQKRSNAFVDQRKKWRTLLEFIAF